MERAQNVQMKARNRDRVVEVKRTREEERESKTESEVAERTVEEKSGVARTYNDDAARIRYT